MELNLFNHKVPIQIRFGDTDMLGHINNSNYLSYMELARMSYITAVLKNKLDWNKEGFIQANAIVNFVVPIHVDDKVDVFIRVSKIGSKSITLDYLFNKTDRNGKESIAANGSTVIVAFNYSSNESITVPESWRKMIEEFERR